MNPDRVQRSVRAAAMGLFTNGVLACVKLAAGVLGNSYALIADAIESFADIISSIIVWRGVVIAARPADADHPYGHGRAETLAAAAVSLMLIGAAGLILVQASREVLTPHHAPKAFTLYVLIGVVLIKETLYRFVKRVGTEIESSVMTADAWHHRSDALTSAAAAIGITIALIGGEGYRAADGIAAIFASFVIGWNGYRLLQPAVAELMDQAPDASLLDQARAAAMTVVGVKDVEQCRARKMGYGYLLDMHVEVDGQLSVLAAHKLAHQVKAAIRAQLPRVNDVTIHIEPHAGLASAAPGRHTPPQ